MNGGIITTTHQDVIVSGHSQQPQQTHKQTQRIAVVLEMNIRMVHLHYTVLIVVTLPVQPDVPFIWRGVLLLRTQTVSVDSPIVHFIIY